MTTQTVGHCGLAQPLAGHEVGLIWQRDTSESSRKAVGEAAAIGVARGTQLTGVTEEPIALFPIRTQTSVKLVAPLKPMKLQYEPWNWGVGLGSWAGEARAPGNWREEAIG